MMRSLCRSLLAFLSLGMLGSVGCGKADTTDSAPTDVTLKVPGMYWATGWPDRVRDALGTLPWVEKKSIVTDIPSREVRFNLTDKKAWNEDAARKALNDTKFKEVTVIAAPKL